MVVPVTVEREDWERRRRRDILDSLESLREAGHQAIFVKCCGDACSACRQRGNRSWSGRVLDLPPFADCTSARRCHCWLDAL